METAEQESALRRLRRIRLVVRLVVYGGLLLVLVPVIAGARRDARGETNTEFLDGRTDQGHGITVMLRDGRPVHFNVGYDAPCEGTPWETGWWARDGKGVTFRFNGDELRVKTAWTPSFEDGRTGRHRVELRAELDGRRLRGVLRHHGVIRWPDGSSYVCESGDVTFFAGD